MPTPSVPSGPARKAAAGQGKPPSASDLVVAGIVGRIEARTFVPGQRLVEADLAQQFGVGRNSVREALQRLAASGIVELSKHKGAAIRQLSAREADDVLDVAERMTGLLARTACRGSAEAQHRAVLVRVLQDLDLCAASRNALAFAAARRMFYRTLLEMGANKELQRLFPTVQMHTVYAQFALPQLQEIRLADYARIARAVMDGDPDEAERAGVDHVRHVRAAWVAERAARAAGDPSADWPGG